MTHKPLKVSASTIATADPKDDGCFRKWYLQNYLKLPQLPMGSTTFGSVLHEVCERYLHGDSNGLVNGKPVNLYPVGWEHPLDRDGNFEKHSISMEEQAIIKNLIATSIEEGILMRVEGREIEKKFDNWEFMDGVVGKGFIDLLEPGAIRDHKTTKSMRWAKSIKSDAKTYLGRNIQMMLYAFWYYTEGGFDKSKPLTLSHQYYCKDPKKPHVERREVSVTWEKVERFMLERIAPTVEMMLVYRDVKKWDDIPLPDDPASACRKYGGCPFARICTNLETVEGYTERINRELTGVNSTDYKKLAKELNPEGETQMSESAMQKKIREMREKQTGTTAPAAEEAEEVVEEVEVVEEPAAEPPLNNQQKAPWHFDGCKACSENPVLGMNSQGLPCRLCDIMTNNENKKEGTNNPTSTDFNWKVEEGKLVVMDGEEVVVESTIAEEPTAKEQVETVSVDTTPATDIFKDHKEFVDCDTPEGAFNKGAFEDLEQDTKLRQGFTIMIGCVVTESKVKGGGKFGSPACRVTAEELMIIVNTEMIRVLGASKWNGMNNFAKCDAVEAMAEHIADAVGNSTLIVTRLPKASLMETVIMGIRPYAKEVIQALAE